DLASAEIRNTQIEIIKTRLQEIEKCQKYAEILSAYYYDTQLWNKHVLEMQEILLGLNEQQLKVKLQFSGSMYGLSFYSSIQDYLKSENRDYLDSSVPDIRDYVALNSEDIFKKLCIKTLLFLNGRYPDVEKIHDRINECVDNEVNRLRTENPENKLVQIKELSRELAENKVNNKIISVKRIYFLAEIKN